MAAITGLPSRIRVGPIGPSPDSCTWLPRSVPMRLEVGAGAEGAAVAVQHRDAGALVGVEGSERVGQGRRGGAVDGVAGVRAVQDHRRDRAVVLDADGSELSLAMAATLAVRSGPRTRRGLPESNVRKAECAEGQADGHWRHGNNSRGLRETVVRALAKVGPGVGGRRARRAVHGDERAGAARRRLPAAVGERRRALGGGLGHLWPTRPAPPVWPSPSSSSPAASSSSPSAPPAATRVVRHKYAAEPGPGGPDSDLPLALGLGLSPDPAERPGPRRDPGRWPGGGGGI